MQMYVNLLVVVVRGKASRRIRKKYEDKLGGSCYRGRTQFETNCLGCRKLIFFCSTYNVDFNTAQNGPTIRLLSRANSFYVSVLRVEHAQVGWCFRNAAEVNS